MLQTVIQEELNLLIDHALAEDIGDGDVTTLWTIPDDAATSGRFISRKAGRIAGLEAAHLTFERLDTSHPIYHTLFDHDEYPGGDKLLPPYGNFDEALMIDDRIVVYFCPVV